MALDLGPAPVLAELLDHDQPEPTERQLPPEQSAGPEQDRDLATPQGRGPGPGQLAARPLDTGGTSQHRLEGSAPQLGIPRGGGDPEHLALGGREQRHSRGGDGHLSAAGRPGERATHGRLGTQVAPDRVEGALLVVGEHHRAGAAQAGQTDVAHRVGDPAVALLLATPTQAQVEREGLGHRQALASDRRAALVRAEIRQRLAQRRPPPAQRLGERIGQLSHVAMARASQPPEGAVVDPLELPTGNRHRAVARMPGLFGVFELGHPVGGDDPTHQHDPAAGGEGGALGPAQRTRPAGPQRTGAHHPCLGPALASGRQAREVQSDAAAHGDAPLSPGAAHPDDAPTGFEARRRCEEQVAHGDDAVGLERPTQLGVAVGAPVEPRGQRVDDRRPIARARGLGLRIRRLGPDRLAPVGVTPFRNLAGTQRQPQQLVDPAHRLPRRPEPRHAVRVGLGGGLQLGPRLLQQRADRSRQIEGGRAAQPATDRRAGVAYPLGAAPRRAHRKGQGAPRRSEHPVELDERNRHPAAYRTSRISQLCLPFGVGTSTSSPSERPMSARPSGDL